MRVVETWIAWTEHRLYDCHPRNPTRGFGGSLQSAEDWRICDTRNNRETVAVPGNPGGLPALQQPVIHRLPRSHSGLRSRAQCSFTTARSAHKTSDGGTAGYLWRRGKDRR